MKRRYSLLIVLALALLAGGGYELWNLFFHKVWRGQIHFSDEQVKNPMLAATRLLEASGHKVRLEPMLNYQLLNQLPDGVLLLSPYARQPDERQAKLLLDWVKRGNTLIMTPGWVQNTDDKADKPEVISEQLPDPMGKHFGVAMSGRTRVDDAWTRWKPSAAKSWRPPAKPRRTKKRRQTTMSRNRPPTWSA
jgi:hypothetical protein